MPAAAAPPSSTPPAELPPLQREGCARCAGGPGPAVTAAPALHEAGASSAAAPALTTARSCSAAGWGLKDDPPPPPSPALPRESPAGHCSPDLRRLARSLILSSSLRLLVSTDGHWVLASGPSAGASPQPGLKTPAEVNVWRPREPMPPPSLPGRATAWVFEAPASKRASEGMGVDIEDAKDNPASSRAPASSSSSPAGSKIFILPGSHSR